jgi:hypothetical protein
MNICGGWVLCVCVESLLIFVFVLRWSLMSDMARAGMAGIGIVCGHLNKNAIQIATSNLKP